MFTLLKNASYITHKEYNFFKIIPSLMTFSALVFGCFAIKLSFYQQWETAILFVMIASLLDLLDGIVARKLNVASSFGRELDTLVDLVNFGVAPAIMIYQWKLKELGDIGWIVSILFIMCSIIRLSRFNIAKKEENNQLTATQKTRNSIFFTGMPTAMAALLSIQLLSIAIVIQNEFGYKNFDISIDIVVFYMFLLSFLMISKLPTLSFSALFTNYIWFTTFLTTIISLMIFKPWFALLVICVSYVVVILPFSFILYRRMSK